MNKHTFHTTKLDTVYVNEDIRDQVSEIFYGSYSAHLLNKLNFDVSKYTMNSFAFLLKDLSSYLYSLNNKYKVFNDFDRHENLEIMCFFEPWMIEFLEKVLEKKYEANKVCLS